MANQNATPDTTTKLTLHFGDNVATAERVLNTIQSEPKRVWRAEELLEATGVGSMMELLMIVARLTYVEMISHPDLGGYCAVDDAATTHTLHSA
jgi:hypothetical protein